MASISLRSSIRWHPSPASEPTSTVVLTSTHRHFVDVRILIPERETTAAAAALEHTEGRETLPRDRLDWAFAGTSASERRSDGSSRSVWRHWVDSRTAEADGVVDAGDVVLRPDGSTLETGRMVNPTTGVEEDYEEVWLDVEPAATPSEGGSAGGSAECVVMRAQEDENGICGVAIRLGQYCQGVLRAGEVVTVERWEWKKLSGWGRCVGIGDGSLPCSALVQGGRNFKKGGTVTVGELRWTVIESESL